jgi:hypothetical protein
MKKSKLCLFSLVVLLGLVGCSNSTPTSSVVSSASTVSSSSISSSSVSSSSSSSSSSVAVKHKLVQKIAPQLFNRDNMGDSYIEFDKDSYEAGETVNYTIYTYGFYQESTFNDQAIMVVGGQVIAFNVVEGEDDTYTGSFTMPDVDETDVTFYAAPYSIMYGSDTAESKTISYNLCDGIEAIAPTSFKAGSKLYSIVLHRSKSISITKATIKIGSESAELDISSLNWQNDFVTFSLGSNTASDDVTLTIEGKEVASHNLTIVGSQYVNYYNNPSSTYMEGETVDFSYGAVNGYNVTCTIIGATNTSSYSGRVAFVMPANDVTITFTGTSYSAVSIEADSHITSSKIYVAEGYSSKVEPDENKVGAGETFYVVCEVEAGYKLGQAYIKGNESNKVSASSIYWGYGTSYSSTYKTAFTFTMPSDGSACTIVIGTTVSGTITLVQDDDHYTSCTVKDSANSYGATEKSLSDFSAGETFYLFPEIVDGFKLTGATINDGTNSAHVDAKTTYSGTSYIEYTMPDSNIANVTFEFGETHEVEIQNMSEVSSKVRFSFSAGSYYAVGDTVTVTITEQYGYTLDKVQLSYTLSGDSAATVKDCDIKVNQYNKKYIEFTMVDADVTIIPTITEGTKASVTFAYANNSTKEVGCINIQSTKGSNISLSSYYVSASASDSATKDLYVGDSISCTVRDYDAFSDETDDYITRFVVTLEITYSDGTPTCTTDVARGNINSYETIVALTANITGIKLIITDIAE